MGGVIEARNLSKRTEVFRLLIYTKPEQVSADTFSINQPLAERLLDIKPFARTTQLETCFNEVVASLPDGAVIKDIDVMFHPEYKVDVLKILISANKQKHFSLIWSGKYANSKLYYSEEHLPDYKVYDISDYDIFCVV